jgi:hypothetical protein
MITLGFGLKSSRVSLENRILAGFSGKTAAWYRFDAGGIWQDTGATTVATTSDPVRRVDDWLGQSDPMTAPDDASRPTLAAGGFQTAQGATYLQVTDSNLLALTNSRVIITTTITGDTQGIFIGNTTSSPYMLFFSNGGSSSVNHGSASGTVYVGDTLITQTNGALDTAIRNQGTQRMENRGSDNSVMTLFNIGLYPPSTSLGVTGFILDVFICDEADLTPTLEADVKAAIDARL